MPNIIIIFIRFEQKQLKRNLQTCDRERGFASGELAMKERQFQDQYTGLIVRKQIIKIRDRYDKLQALIEENNRKQQEEAERKYSLMVSYGTRFKKVFQTRKKLHIDMYGKDGKETDMGKNAERNGRRLSLLPPIYPLNTKAKDSEYTPARTTAARPRRMTFTNIPSSREVLETQRRQQGDLYTRNSLRKWQDEMKSN